MNGKGLYAAILQLFSQSNDDFVVGIPAQPRLDGDRQTHGINHGAGNLQHQRHIAQHACPRPLARHAFDGTAEVEVDDIGVRLLHNLRGFDHCCHVAPVDLDGHGAFGITDVQFLFGFADRAYQGIGRHELGVHHVGSKLFTHQAESGIGNVFHRGKQHGAFAQVNSGNLHLSVFLAQRYGKKDYLCLF